MAAAQEKRQRSIFELPSNTFDSCRLISPASTTTLVNDEKEKQDEKRAYENDFVLAQTTQANRTTCNICKQEFESLQEQRSHFKSLIHLFNVKLSIAGKSIVKEEDFDELTSDSFKDFDVSSISGSEDEADRGSGAGNKGFSDSFKNRLFVQLRTGEICSVWKSLLLNECEDIIYEDQKADSSFSGGSNSYLKEDQVIEKLKRLVQEPRDKTGLRIVLLASGGHFAGCVFDGNSVVAHKTFHRYVVRAKAGKKQSSKDAGGKTIHSAGAALRRYNELGLKKDIQELLAAWAPYFDASSSIFVHAPSSNRQLLYNGEKPYFRNPNSVIRNIPFTIRRPTHKEACRVYNCLTQLTYELCEIEDLMGSKEGTLESERILMNVCTDSKKEFITIDSKFAAKFENGSAKMLSDEKIDSNFTESSETFSTNKSDEQVISSESESEVIGTSTALHVAARSGDAQQVLELLEQGLDPCVKDERGWTPYMLAKEKEVRNTVRRFMALNIDKWDWHAAKVPSALTKEMEESQAAKQAEKDAKKKARAKELKKLKKAKEKKAQAQAAASQNATTGIENRGSTVKDQSEHKVAQKISKEEELKRVQAAEREKRAAAAERRIAAAAAAAATSSGGLGAQGSGLPMDIICSCCNASLAGKVPFHRYNYKYCSTACMRVHREALEDG